MKSMGKTIRLFEGSAAVHEDKSQYSRTHAQPVNLAHDKSKHRPINALTHSCHEQKRLSREIPSVATPRQAQAQDPFVIRHNATCNSSNLPLPFFPFHRWNEGCSASCIYISGLHVLRRSSTWRTADGSYRFVINSRVQPTTASFSSAAYPFRARSIHFSIP